jgi:hypothetical protein
MVAEDSYSRIKKVIATQPEKKHKDLGGEDGKCRPVRG